jgi:hypothetical protein
MVVPAGKETPWATDGAAPEEPSEDDWSPQAVAATTRAAATAAIRVR